MDNAGVVGGNEVFKDRETGSRWQQSSLEAISGPLKGERLDLYPFLLTEPVIAKLEFEHHKVVLRGRGVRRRCFVSSRSSPYSVKASAGERSARSCTATATRSPARLCRNCWVSRATNSR